MQITGNIDVNIKRVVLERFSHYLVYEAHFHVFGVYGTPVHHVSNKTITTVVSSCAKVTATLFSLQTPFSPSSHSQ